jgi:hypothetical protein
MAIHAETMTHTQTVEIHVNERPVRVVRPRVTGLEIKEAAIAQGVSIQLDFVLSEELGERRTKVIGDTDTVTVNKESRFLAIPNDDNS